MTQAPSCPGIGVGSWSWGNQFLWGYHPDQFFDTADSHGTGRFNGRSEELLGRFCAALPKKLRDDLTVATKLAPFPWCFELRRSLRGRG